MHIVWSVCPNCDYKNQQQVGGALVPRLYAVNCPECDGKGRDPVLLERKVVQQLMLPISPTPRPVPPDPKAEKTAPPKLPG